MVVVIVLNSLIILSSGFDIYPSVLLKHASQFESVMWNAWLIAVHRTIVHDRYAQKRPCTSYQFSAGWKCDGSLSARLQSKSVSDASLTCWT